MGNHITIKKDVTELKGPFILIHVANNKGFMGAGVAKAIVHKWPRVLTDYRAVTNMEGPVIRDSASILGTCVVSCVEEEGFVISMICQDNYGTVKNKCYLDYGAFHECLEQVARISTNMGIPVYAPKGIGCGLAGGNPELVRLSMQHLDVTFCELGE